MTREVTTTFYYELLSHFIVTIGLCKIKDIASSLIVHFFLQLARRQGYNGYIYNMSKVMAIKVENMIIIPPFS